MAIMWLEGLRGVNRAMNSSGIEHRTFELVARCLNQLGAFDLGMWRFLWELYETRI
jgi:hypothetical protein